MGSCKFLTRRISIGILYTLCPFMLAAQIPQKPSSAIIPNYTQNTFFPATTTLSPASSNIYTGDNGRQNQQQADILKEVQSHERAREKAMNEIRVDTQAMRKVVSYLLPSYSDEKGSEFYYQAFDKIIMLDTAYTLKGNTFLIENAYFENTMDNAKFDQAIKESAAFLTAKMKEQGYDLKSNAAKNFMLFQFFAEPLQLKSSKQKHLPFKYDFEDYMGLQNYSKMFVSKLLATGAGQCHSMPLLYLMLAEEINAEAYLALSPNHSYIRFPDDKGKWYNIELTNGMLSTDSFILQSGYIKSEALQNKIYMENLNRAQMLAHILTDMAQGYIHKFGYDEFVTKVIDKALQLSPNSINANMVKANLDSARLEFVLRQIGKRTLKDYPKAVALMEAVKKQYGIIDQLGYEPMPEEAYREWLQSLNEESQKQKNEEMSKQLKKTLNNHKNARKG